MQSISSNFLKFLVLPLVLISSLHAVSPTVNFRSQGRDAARKIVGTVGHTHEYDFDYWYGMFTLTPEYTHSFRSRQITECLFGCNGANLNCNTSKVDCNAANVSCSNAIRIMGSNYDAQDNCDTGVTRDPRAWLADYFYLPPDFNGFITFHPDISNFLVELDLYIGFNSWCDKYKGFYARFYGPITHTKWDLDFCEQNFTEGNLPYPEGYFTPSELPNSALLTRFGQYLQGQVPAVAADQDVILQPLRFAKIACDSRTETGFAELRGELGWDFINCDDYHLGFNFQFAAPTGTRRLAEFAFNPVIGNGKHWEAGAGVTGHYVFWRDCDEIQSFGLYVDLNVTHRFAREEQRTFDLCGKPNSRYMLAERLGTPVEDNLEGGDVAPTYQFKREFAPVANLTTFCVDVTIPAVADLAFMFNYTHCDFSVDFGYNFWARSCEKFDCTCVADPFTCDPNNKWALKGDSRVFGYLPANFSSIDCSFVDGVAVPANCDAVALSATQSQASICNGRNRSCDLTDPNTAIDNPALATGGPMNDPLMIDRMDITQINTSVEPILLSLCDVDFQATRGISHKLFAHFSYNWSNCGCWTPFLGIGGYAEFGKNESCSSDCCPVPCGDESSSCTVTHKTICASDCSNCEKCSLSQWGIWIKGGASFD